MISEYMKIVAGLGEYYDKTLSPNQIEMYAQDLSVLSPDDLKKAILEYRTNPENVFFPLPGKLISIINPHLNEKDEAQDVSNLIIAAVGKFGYTNFEAAKKHIGELAWEVVTRIGGWKHLCETLCQENEGIFRAQIRDLSMTVSKKAKRGELDKRPELPQNNEVRKLIGDTFK